MLKLSVKRSTPTGECVPEAGGGVVQGVIFSLHLVVQDNGTLFQGVAYQVLTHNDHGHAGTAYVLLSAGVNQPKLQQKR